MAKVAYEILENGDKKRVFAEDEAKLGRKIYSQKRYVCCGDSNGIKCKCPVKLVSVGCKHKPYFKVIDEKNFDHIAGCSNNEKAEKTPINTLNYAHNAYGDIFNVFEEICLGSEKNSDPKDGERGHTDGPETEVYTPEKYNTKDIEIKYKKPKNSKDIYHFLNANITGNIPYKGGEAPAKNFIFNNKTFGDFKRGISTFDGYCVVFAKKGVPDEKFKSKYYDFSKKIYHLFDVYSRDIVNCKYRKIAFQLNFSSKRVFESVNKKLFSKDKYKLFIVLGDWSIVNNDDSSDYLVCRCTINRTKQIVAESEE